MIQSNPKKQDGKTQNDIERTDRREKEGNHRLLTEVSDGGENREREKVSEDAENELIDADVERHLGDDVVAPIEDLDQYHGHVRP